MKKELQLQSVDPQSVHYLVQLFGETKTAREWIADPRTSCKTEQLYRFRINKCKLSPTDALMATKRVTKHHGLITYNGITQSVYEWGHSQLCVVSWQTFRARYYHLRWSLEKSLLTPANRSGRKRKAA